MQILYNRVMSYSHPMYMPPSGEVRKTFIINQAKEWTLAQTQETKSERTLIFVACILREERGITQASAIKR